MVPSRPSRHLGRDGASAQVVALMAAVIVYVVLFATITEYGSKGNADAFHDRHLEARADSAVALITGESGLPVDWESAPDNLSRFGLREESSGSQLVVLDDAKIRSLRLGVTSATANGAPDYEEVRAALGLGEEFDFHLRIYPVLAGLDGPLFQPDPHMQVAYIGHYTSSGTPGGVANHSTDGGTYRDFHLTIWNNGTSVQPFRATFYLDTPSGNQVVDEQDTPSVATGASATIVHRVYGYDAWNLGTKLHYRVQDSGGRTMVEGHAAFAPPADSGNAINVIVQPASSYFLTTDNEVRIYLDHYNKDGARLSGGAKVDVEIRDKVTGALVWSQTDVSLPKNKETSISCIAAACLQAGTYTITVSRAGTGVYPVSEDYDVLLAAPSQSYVESGYSRFESGVLDELYAGYDNHTDLATGGDKAPDTQDHVSALVAQLDTYDILVVGSNVEHSAMTSAEVKYGIRDWVYEGGTLVVLGSSEQNVQWLQPFAGSGLDSASGGIGTPDPTHPSLTVPNRLRYEAYADPGTAWHLTKNRADEYTHVLVRETNSNDGTHDLLAVSRPGMYGNGTVVLTSYIPQELFNGPAEEVRDEARRFLHNLGSQALNRATADFGPTIPAGVSVGYAERSGIALHPKTENAYVELRVVIYVWS